MTRATGTLLLALLLLPALGAQEPVIYPRGSAPADAASPAVPGKPAGPSPLFLMGSVIAAVAGAWWYWNRRRGGLVNSQPAKLSIVESRSLGSRQHLVVADYDGRKFLLSVCPGSIDLLTPLDGEPPPPKS